MLARMFQSWAARDVPAYTGQLIVTALPRTGVWPDEESFDVFCPEGCVNSLTEVRSHGWGGRRFLAANSFALPVDTESVKTAQNQRFWYPGESAPSALEADLAARPFETLSPKKPAIIGRVEEGRG